MNISGLLAEIEGNLDLRRIFYRMKIFSEDTAALSPLLVTSAVKGEGKTTVSVILSLIFHREMDKKCLIVDANWEDPGLHRWFDLPLTFSYSRIISTPGECLQKTKYPGIDILCAPADIGDKKKTECAGDTAAVKEIFNSLRNDYELIIIDSQPVFSSFISPMDPLYLASFVRSSLMTVLMRKTDRALLKRAKIAIEDVNDNLSVILNNAYNPIYSQGAAE